MKKIALFFLAAVTGLSVVSCVKEKLVTFDMSQAVPPVIDSYVMDEKGDVAVTFTPAAMGQSFNEKMPVSHSLVLLSADGKDASRVLSSTVDGNIITVSARNLSRGLATLGYVDGDVVKSVSLSLRASLQDQARDNGINGYVESVGRIALSDVLVSLPKESPYKEYTKDSDWTIIGALSAYEISWDKDLNMWTDGKHNHVAAHVALGKDDEFKFRKDLGWDVNMGGEFGGIDSEFDVTQDGANIKVGEEGIYDIFFNDETGKAWILEAFDPYPDYTQSSTWSIIGELSVYGISWNGDIPMISDGTSHLALSVSLGEKDAFKFRKDADWAVNLGGEFGGVGSEFSVGQDGANIEVKAEGVYDIMVNPDAGKAMVSEASGARVSSIVVVAEPEEPEGFKGWGVIGLNGDWDNDIALAVKENVWYAYITAKEETTFKFRKDAGWDENYGMPKEDGFTYSMGTAFPAVAGGENIPLAAGFYKVELNLSDDQNPTITIYDNVEVWSLIGNFNSWGGDVDMELKDGKWVSPAVQLDNKGFKIRKNHDWGASYGGTFVKLGEPFDATTTDNNNIMLEEDGEYVVTFDPSALKITVEPALPANLWSVIGGVNGTSWNKDFYMTETEGVWVSESLEFETGAEFKLRFNNSWADEDCLGGATGGIELAPGVPVTPVHPGNNLKIKEAGSYFVVYDSNKGIVYLQGWALIGTINGTNWNRDFLMTVGQDGRWYSDVVSIEGDFKLRRNGSWADADTRGAEGDGFQFTPLTSFTATAPGKNIGVPATGRYVIAFNAESGEVTAYRAEWALIGNIDGTSWNKDFSLIEWAEGVYSAKSVKLEGEFKLRRNGSWADENTRGYAEGGFAFTPGTEFNVLGPGNNIGTPEAGVYDVAYYPAEEKVLITTTAK